MAASSNQLCGGIQYVGCFQTIMLLLGGIDGHMPEMNHVCQPHPIFLLQLFNAE
jgi:hypothetical protein